MESDVAWLIGILLGGVIVVLAYDVLMGLHRETGKDKQDRQDRQDRKAKLLFCPDCGSAKVTVRTQLGFKETTGEPDYRYSQACPNRTGMPPGAFYWTGDDRGRCWNLTHKVTKAGTHSHDDPNDTQTDCAACIDIMLRDGVIDTAAAAKLYDSL